MQKIFLTSSLKARITCPECLHEKQMDVSRFCKSGNAVKLKCTCRCGHHFNVLLERRKHIRRAVDLEGQLTVGSERWQIRVADISRLGLKLKVPEEIAVEVGTKVTVSFRLDDSANSSVTKDVKVSSVHGLEIGVEFLSHDHYDPLGPYLLFHFS